MKLVSVLSLFFGLLCFHTTSFSQNYTSTSNGNWTTGSTWTNISGWGGATPPLSGQGSGTISVGHNISIGANYSLGSAVLNINAGSTLTINGNLTVGGGSTINVSGTLIINGSAALNSNLNILPGGQVFISNTLTVNSAPYLTVGTNVAAPPYADLIVYGDIVSAGSGDITVNQNGRVAAFGNLTATGGGTLLTVNNGGQVYIHGNINFSGGGSSIVNSNTTSPYGLYVNGTITNSGGGSTTTPNQGDETTMQNTNPQFYNWVANLPSSLLPVTLLYFKADVIESEVILTWATATEKNADYFVVEKSFDGKTFFSIDTIPATGNSNTIRNYLATDRNPVIGRSYYRLSETDYDGTKEYFNLVFAQYQSRKQITILPTLLYEGESLQIKSNFTSERSAKVSIVNLSGVVVSQFDFTGMSMDYSPDFSNGMYIIRIQYGTEIHTSRFLIR